MSTPFAIDGAAYTGADPGEPQFWRVGEHKFWLGRPDRMMIELPSPNPDGYTAAQSLGEVEHALLGGTSAVTAFDSITRRWTIHWPRLAGRDWQVVNGFYRRLFGADPWCFVPPEDVNRLTLAQSMCGGLNGVVEGWGVQSGTLTYDSTVTPAIFPSGVMRWAGAGSPAKIVAGSWTTTDDADPDHVAPVLASEPVTGSMFAAAASGTPQVAARLIGFAADATTVVTTLLGPTVTLGATPQLVYVTAAPGDLAGCAYVTTGLRHITGAGDILISCAQLQYDDLPSDWEAGCGVPRVVWPTGPGRGVDVNMTSDVTMTLAEAITGAG